MTPKAFFGKEASSRARRVVQSGDVLFSTIRTYLKKSRRTNYQGTAMSYYRTPENRARQSAAIQQWRPWEHSTGPKCEDGKARVSRNAFKGGTRVTLRELARLLREQVRAATQ